MVNSVHPFKPQSKINSFQDKQFVKEALMEDTYDKRQAEVLPFTTVSLRTQANLYSVCCVCVERGQCISTPRESYMHTQRNS